MRTQFGTCAGHASWDEADSNEEEDEDVAECPPDWAAVTATSSIKPQPDSHAFNGARRHECIVSCVVESEPIEERSVDAFSIPGETITAGISIKPIQGPSQGFRH